MTLPNFIVIGAAKSGTTAFYDFLRQHPQIFTSPVKEPKYFAIKAGLPNWSGPGDREYLEKFTINTEDKYRQLLP